MIVNKLHLICCFTRTCLVFNLVAENHVIDPLNKGNDAPVLGAQVHTQSTVGESAQLENAMGSLPTVLDSGVARHHLIKPREELDLSGLFSRPFNVGTVNWGAEQASNILYPLELLLAGALQNRLLDYRQHMRATVVVTITSTTTPHHYGLAAFNLAPCNPRTPIALTLGRILSADNTALIDASSANSIKLKLPFSLPYEFINLNATSYPNYLKDACVLTHMGVTTIKRDDGGTVGTPRFNIYVTLEDVQFTGYSPYAVAGPNPEAATEAGPITTISQKVKDVALSVENTPIIGWAAKAVADIAGGVNTIAAWFGWSRPSKPKDIEWASTAQKLGNTINANLPDYSQKLALFTETEYVCNQKGVGGVADALSYDYLLKRWGWVTTIAWTQAGVKGDRLSYFAVHPGTCPTGGTGEKVLTPLAMCALFNDRWFGTIKYRFIIPGTPYVKGSLLIAYTPNETSASTQTISQLTSTSQYVIVDLAQGLDKVIEVGWHSSRLNKLCGDPLAVNTASPNSNGYLSMYILEPIVSSASSGVDLSIVILACAGSDFNLSHPSDIGVYNYVLSGPFRDIPIGGRTETSIANFHTLTKALKDINADVERNNANEQARIKRLVPDDVGISADEVLTQDYKLSGPPDVYDIQDVNQIVLPECKFGYRLDDNMTKHVEVTPSFRALLKRYWLVAGWKNTIDFTNNFAAKVSNDKDESNEITFRLDFPLFPPISNATNTYTPSSDVSDVNNPWFLAMSPFNMIAASFVGLSGAMKYRAVSEYPACYKNGVGAVISPEHLISLQCTVPTNSCAEDYNFAVGSVPTTTSGYIPIYSYSGNTEAPQVNVGKRAYSTFGSVGNGSLNSFSQNERYVSSSIELPYSSAYRYEYPCVSGMVGEADHLQILLRTRWPLQNSDVSTGPTMKHAAMFYMAGSAGEDFNAFFFTGCPMIKDGPSGFYPPIVRYPHTTVV